MLLPIWLQLIIGDMELDLITGVMALDLGSTLMSSGAHMVYRL